MKMNRVMIAAPGSGSGKTMTTCALLQALKNRGEHVVSFKCGPDYIDPMFHQKVIGIPSKNLDTFFTGEEETKRLFLRNRTPEEFAVIEGVMGLYDGLGGVRKEGSSYHLADVTRTPIILVVDAKGMGRSVIPLIAGFLAYDPKHLVKGVILNRMSKSYYETIKPLVEEALGICVAGYFPENGQFHIGSRHLGLTLPDEMDDIKTKLQAAAAELEKTVSLEQIMRIAGNAGELYVQCRPCADGLSVLPGPDHVNSRNPLLQNRPCADGFPHLPEPGVFLEGEAPVIAVAKDEAFCFYYEDNLSLLEDFGAQTVSFSPLHDTKLPDGCSGLLIGGGYPELYAGELAKNTRMHLEIRTAVRRGMPLVAECGGFMYLHSILEDQAGRAHAMADVTPGVCRYIGKPVRFGYMELAEKQSNFLPPHTWIRGHEFHYFDSENNGGDCIARKPVTGKTYPCVISHGNVWMGFPHLYYPSNPEFAKNFVGKACGYRGKRASGN